MSDVPPEPSPEDPNRFPSDPEQVAPLDESPDGATPSDSKGPTPGQMPPGLEHTKPED